MGEAEKGEARKVKLEMGDGGKEEKPPTRMSAFPGRGGDV